MQAEVLNILKSNEVGEVIKGYVREVMLEFNEDVPLTASVLSKKLGISTKTIARWAESGKIENKSRVGRATYLYSEVVRVKKYGRD